MLQKLFFLIFVRPFTLIIVGINRYGSNKLPVKGPALVVANHNSHLDTLVLMSLFPLKTLNKVRPVAAADYFLKNAVLAWVTTTFFGILPIVRKREKNDLVNPLDGIHAALGKGEIVLMYPEGSRGEPEQMVPFKMGVAKLSEQYPDLPVFPVCLQGLGKSLPKGEAIFVPFFCDLAIGESLTWNSTKIKTRPEFVNLLQDKIKHLKSQIPDRAWV